MSDAAQQMKELVKKGRPAMAEVLPKVIDEKRFARVLISAVNTTPKLADCEPMTVLGSMMVSAQLGLEPNTPQGHAYLVPYKHVCQLIIGYRGMIELAMRSGLVSHVSDHVVRANDEFDIRQGSEESISHKIDPFKSLAERGERVGAYAIFHLKDGGRVQRFLTAEEIMAARPKFWDKTPWSGKIQGGDTVNEFIIDEMWAKTAIRRTAKRAPQSPELARGIQADEQASCGAVYTMSGGEVVVREPETIDATATRVSGKAALQMKMKGEAAQSEEDHENRAIVGRLMDDPEIVTAMDLTNADLFTITGLVEEHGEDKAAILKGLGVGVSAT